MHESILRGKRRLHLCCVVMQWCCLEDICCWSLHFMCFLCPPLFVARGSELCCSFRWSSCMKLYYVMHYSVAVSWEAIDNGTNYRALGETCLRRKLSIPRHQWQTMCHKSGSRRHTLGQALCSQQACAPLFHGHWQLVLVAVPWGASHALMCCLLYTATMYDAKKN